MVFIDPAANGARNGGGGAGRGRGADAVVVHHVDIAGDERVSNTLSIIETLIPRHTLRIQTAMSPTALRFLLVRLISTVVRSP